MSWRWVGLAVRGALLALWALSWAAQAFDFETVSSRARDLMAKAYQAPATSLPAELRDLDYDALHDIRFRPEHALWRADKLPFEVMFFHPGRNFQYPVRINTVDLGGVHRVDFDPTMFDYGRNNFDPDKFKQLGFAGFRIHYPVNKPGYKDEVMVFLGASYFRAVGQGQVYGLAGRGVALDTATSQGEEFPRFVEFWIERPRANAGSLTIYALLDSPRMTGAFRFVLTPGVDTQVQVTERLYARETVGKLGLAPLNSMFLFGENQPARDDYRPKVHDSDGLSIALSDGEWIWRPLVNPKRLLVTSFAAVNPKGFGLMQRDRSPSSYEDPETQYERRPSAWVEPLSNWGAGRIELVQIPTPDETNDNIVAYWVSDRVPVPRQAYNVSYRLHWQLNGPVPNGKGWVVQTRRGHGSIKSNDPKPGADDLNFLVDFDGGALRALKPEATLEPVVEVGDNGTLLAHNLVRNLVSGVWRLNVRVKRGDVAKPIELRAFLRPPHLGPITETWSYIIPPEPADKP